MMALGSTHKVAHTLENRYKTNIEKATSIIMNYVKYMRVHILTGTGSHVPFQMSVSNSSLMV